MALDPAKTGSRELSRYHLPEDESPPGIASALKIESTRHSCHPLGCPRGEAEESPELESSQRKLGRVSAREFLIGLCGETQGWGLMRWEGLVL